MTKMKYIELEFEHSYTHCRFLEDQSLSWLKYHFAFFPGVLVILGWLLKLEITTIDQAHLIKYIAITSLAILFLVGLCDLYNQTTARIGYTIHVKNINSLYDKLSIDSYISRMRAAHPFWKGDTTRYFYIWDFWSARTMLVSIVNGLTLSIIISMSYLNYKTRDEQVVLQWSPNITILIIIFGFFAVLQFSVYALTLQRFDRIDRKCLKNRDLDCE